MSCIEQKKYKILLEKTTFKESREFIENNSDEVHYVSPGYKIFNDYYVIGIPPIALGVKGNALLFTYTKPCHGTFVLTIDDEGSKTEINRLRERENVKTTASLKKGKPPESAKAPPTSYADIWKNEK
jgi:hypothetical protein